jgi:hypothetical protein
LPLPMRLYSSDIAVACGTIMAQRFARGKLLIVCHLFRFRRNA